MIPVLCFFAKVMGKTPLAYRRRVQKAKKEYATFL